MASANDALKKYAKQKGVFLWELAAKLGITDATFSRRLRKQFPPEETEKAMRYVDEIAAERRN